MKFWKRFGGYMPILATIVVVGCVGTALKGYAAPVYEVEQPETQYIFRMQDKGGIQCALFEADGGAWGILAMDRIKRYLQEALSGVAGYIVIS